MPQKNFYIENDNYTRIVEKQDEHSFFKYVDFIIKLSRGKKNILDVGCGTGIALKLFLKKKKKRLKKIVIHFLQNLKSMPQRRDNIFSLTNTMATG